MIDFIDANVVAASVHRVGNKGLEEALTTSENALDIEDAHLRGLLLNCFKAQFKEPELFEFHHSSNNTGLNPLFNYSVSAFDMPDEFQKCSVHMARHLYEVSMHPQIKAGDLFVVRLSHVRVHGESTEAIGLFKSEVKVPFLKLLTESKDQSLTYEEGIAIDKVDKACLILDEDRDTGLKVCVKDNTNKGSDAQFWRDNFLHVQPCNDEFHQTKEFMGMAKSFITDKLPEQYEVERTDQMDLLNKSLAFFKENDHFEREAFDQQVLQNPAVIESFKEFDKEMNAEREAPMEEAFSISNLAVKKESKTFKSVLKLDKNFHIYVHGDRDLIERGFDDDKGMKYYKVFYDEER